MNTRNVLCLLAAALALSAVGVAQQTGQYLFPVFDGKATVPVVKVSSGRVIHRFFDTSPLSPSGRYLALFRFPQETRSPKPGEVGEVILVDRQTGKERVVAQSRGWEMQLGANVQWGNTDEALYFNDVDTTSWSAFAVQLNPLTGKSRRMGGTVFMASADGTYLASYNLLASRRAQVGYGVMVPDAKAPRNSGPVATDGIDMTDTRTGVVKRIVTIKDIYEKTIPGIAIPNPQDYEYYCFQVKWNPQGTRLLTTLQWTPKTGGDRRRSVITMRPDGSDLRTAITPDQWAQVGHHINWTPDGEHLSMNLNVDGKPGLELITVKYDGTDMKTVFSPGSGHPSFNPLGGPLMVTDAYPGELGTTDGTVPIRLMNTQMGKEEAVVNIFLSKAGGEFRIDAHPAWDRSGRYVIFNGFLDGTRNVFMADLKGKLDEVKTSQPGTIPANWKEVGQLKTRDAKAIKSSTWSIGGETLDRDYTDYQSYRTYLGPLGAKRIRLQGGWSKCEKVKAEGRPGVYDWKWLDVVIPDAASRGVAPWVELSYGNPIYEGGGEARLAGHIPTSPEALVAWDNWVRAIVTRYKNQVPEWEIWNEPDLNKDHTGAEIARFYIRTARLVKSVQPNARLIALGMASITKLDFVRDFFDMLKQENALDLVDMLTYHGYRHNPDDSYPPIEAMRKLVWSYNPKIVFMQGENGAPSQAKGTTVGALTDQDWSELTQAKWDLRRMLGDHGRGIATNLFTISNIHYAAGDHMVGINSKGLLQTNPDKTIKRPKMAYKAAQHVFSLFDDQLELLPEVKPTISQETVNGFAYRYKRNGGSLLTLWSKEARPAETYVPKPTTVTVKGQFKTPVFVDLITGHVYEIPKSNWSKTGENYAFTGLPVPDYPVVIADKSTLSF